VALDKYDREAGGKGRYFQSPKISGGSATGFAIKSIAEWGSWKGNGFCPFRV